MHIAISIALLLLGSGLMLSAQDTAGVEVPQQSQQWAESMAIQKTLILSSLLEAEGKDAQACVDYARLQGAPKQFVALLEAAGKDMDEVEESQIIQQIQSLLEHYQIDTARLHLWANICMMDADEVIHFMDAEAGSAALSRELQAVPSGKPATLPTEQHLKSSDAMKKSLLMLNLLYIEDYYRISDENLAQFMDFAIQSGAPSIFIKLMRADASRDTSPQLRYEINSYLNELLEAYLIDRIALRNYAEGCGLPPSELIPLLTTEDEGSSLNVRTSFNLLPNLEDADNLPQLCEIWLKDTRKLAETLSAINQQNAEQVRLSDISTLLSSYARVQSIQQGRDPNLTRLLVNLNEEMLRNLLLSIKVSQAELYRLLMLKERLPTPLLALLAQMM